MKNDVIIIKPEQVEAEWYAALVEECKAIITEAVFTSRWALVEGYHMLGIRILEENENFAREKIYGEKIVARLRESLDISGSTIWRSIQFAKKYPDLSKVPEGKNITWNKLITKYLPAPKETETPAFPARKYSILYADPPWQYDFSETESRAIESKYPTMTVEQIKELPVPAENDAVLFLWATAPKLREALQVLAAWGFEYKTHAVWDKEIIGMGYWFRGQHELLLVGTKGNGINPPEESRRSSSIIMEKRTTHSKKPEKVYKIIETMFPDQNKIELFARAKRDGWTSWGSDV